MSGGYLGVSVFFTLSGFLITSLLVTELQRTGDLRLRRFYGRRARRLLPASLVCLAGACILIMAEVVPDRSGLRWYLFGGLFQFANWVPLGLRNSYSELFDALSPTDHFWSLAIEEQFYWLWPVTMLGLFRSGPARPIDMTSATVTPVTTRRGSGRLLRMLIGLFVVFAHLGAAHRAAGGTGRGLLRNVGPCAGDPRRRVSLAVVTLGIAAALDGMARLRSRWSIVVVLSVVTPGGKWLWRTRARCRCSHSSAPRWSPGLQHPSPLTTLLSAPPLVFLGRISYGVYLYHWPVFVVLTPERDRLGRPGRSSIAPPGVTFAIAIVSFFCIEQPIRERRVLRPPRIGLLAGGARRDVRRGARA